MRMKYWAAKSFGSFGRYSGISSVFVALVVPLVIAHADWLVGSGPPAAFAAHTPHAKKPPKAPHAGKHDGKKKGPVAAPAPAAPTARWADPAAAFAAGQTAFLASDDATTVDAMTFALTAAKPEPRANYFLGRSLGRQGKYNEARAALETFLKTVPVGDEADIAGKLLADFAMLAKTHFAVASTPAGATFYLDAPDGPSAVAPGDLPAAPGDHKLFVTLNGYETRLVDAKSEAGEAVPVAVALRPLGCDITAEVLLSATSGTVRIDDEDPAPTPGPVRMRPGKHMVELAAAGGEPLKQEVMCKHDEPLKLALTVPAVETGRIALTVPPGGRAQIDGEEMKLENQQALLDIKAGEHLIDVQVEGRVPWHTAALVHAGETLEVTPALEAGGGATGVEVTVEPPTAKITVDGVAAKSGVVTSTGAGKRRIEVHARGYLPTIRTIEIIKGERAHVEVHLQQRGRYLLWLGLAAIPVAVAAEGLALLGHVNAGSELAGSAPYNRWHALEVSGHIVAGAGAAVAVGALTGWLVLSQKGEGSPTVSIAPSTNGASIALSGGF